MGAGCSGDENNAPTSGISSGDHRFQLSVDSLDREFLVHVPTLYSEEQPSTVVLMFHGGGGTAQGVMTETGWLEKADLEGFLAVFPEGSRADPLNPMEGGVVYRQRQGTLVARVDPA